MTTKDACADTTAMVRQIVKLLLSNQMMSKKMMSKKRMKKILEKTVTMKEKIILEETITLETIILEGTMKMKMLLRWSTLLNNSIESGQDLIGVNKNLQGHSIK